MAAVVVLGTEEVEIRSETEEAVLRLETEEA
jgi:hypothetical protein